ncbi:integrase catalytic domain-containing protein [Trichonephila clavipes]|uniref:Integrase catalytic domain-containing protein n=1 Tax=Trichonephila clavipes TaxID=2585209 RepID=A0A8X6VHR0_TRICX|nr:integrase catalytic domain-containing protein [Trichonephila clavipes]
MTPSEPNSSIPRDANNSVLSAKVFHPVVFDATNTVTGTNPPNVNNPSITSCSGFDSNSQVLLCTALVNVCDSFGGTRLSRVLLDPGSQACLITSSCLLRLGLPRKRTNVRISCLGASDTRTNGISEIKFTPHFTSNVSFVTSVYVVNKIVGQLPHFSLDSSWSEPFSDLKLADPTFFKSGPIDILIGVNIALPMLKGQSLSLEDNKPFAVRSDLGEERACEDHFIDTHVRNEDGRYVVRLPFHSSPSKLGDSRESAIRRFKSLEHSLIKKPAIYSQYRDFMQEYLTLGHMELVPKNDYAKREAYYLPHHAVLRDSSTTKLRVVFDASAKSTSGYSLNDILMVGPRLQRDVYPILLSFRTFQIAVCADLEKMFRQIRISSEDTNWQRILWRDNPKETVKEYRLATVTYGTSCAPYLSTRTLTQLAFDERERYPLASFATLHHFYVDDLLSGAATEKEAVELVWQLKEMMKKGGFNLRKWQSNSEIVIKEVAENKDLKRVQNDEEIKILGIQWNPKSDFFSFSVSLLEERCIYSKRDVLSEIARVFDPLGLLSPCIVFMKILLQELWKLNLEWDEPIPEDLNKQWTTFRKELHLIEKIKIPREFPLSIHKTIAWTDSTITLAWLKTEPYRWQPFVANRVSKIQTTIPSVEWCHVSGIENPADLGTRGLLPPQLVAHDQWIHGPLWLNQPMNETSSYKIPETFSFPDNALKEKRSVVTCVAKIVPLPEFIDRISSFTKLVRVCAWILRFIKNSRSPVSRTFGYLKSSELHTAVVTIVRLIQQVEFPNEFKCLFQGNPLPKDNKLLPLNLFCDSEGVLRVGGRLPRNTRLSYDQKHPMLLPKSHEFTRKKVLSEKIISDNGSNFKGASSHLRKLVDLCLQEEVQIPHTLEIEACLNSRPLTELSPDPSEFNALTPAHFFVGGPIHQFPEPSQPSRSVGLSERWNLIQRLRQYSWDRWSTKYLHRLQPRSKWWRTKPNLQLGNMVIVSRKKKLLH